MRKKRLLSRQAIACFFHKLNQKEGQIMLYTIIVMGVLVIIASALISFAVMSVRIASIQHATEKAFYLSDAAMEETLTQLESSVHSAEKKALEAVNDTKRYYGEAKWQAFLSKINQDTLDNTLSSAQAEERLRAATAAEFLKQYYFELYNEPSDTTWLKQDYALLDSSGNYVNQPKPLFEETALSKAYFQNLETITLDPSKVKGYEETGKPLMKVDVSMADNTIQLKLTSTGQFNKYKKPIIVNISLSTPDYTQVVKTVNTTKTVHRNDILGYGLAARGDIVVANGDQNTINGDVYSYGTFPEGGTYRINTLGGVLVGYKASSNILNSAVGDFDPSTTNSKASLTVNGNVMTRAGVRLFGNQGNVNISGNLYANTLYFDEGSSSASANISRNLYLYEDLYLAGNSPTLTVGKSIDQGDGLFWGIMQQQVNSNNLVSRSDMSSSIIVDSDSIHPRITVNSAYIAGVAYFNVFRHSEGQKKYYQTGESFTTNHNFYFYDTKSSGNTALTTSAVAYTDEDGKAYYLYEALNANGEVISNVQFKSDVFYQGGLKNPDAISSADRQIFTVRSLDLDSSGDIQGLENNYALGVIIANSKVIDPYPNIGTSEKPKSEYTTDAVFQGMKRTVMKAADQAVSLLSTRNYSNDTNVDPNGTSNTRIDEYITWPKQQIANIADPNAIAVVSQSDGVNVYVNIPDAIANQIKANEPNSIFIRSGGAMSNMKGIIATRGNVVVYNNDSDTFTFTGTIIANKNIILKGTGPKVFNYSENDVYGLLVRNPELASVFSLDVGKKLTLQQVNGADSTSANGSLTLSVQANDSQLTLPAGQVPQNNGMMKKQTEFSFKIKGWSVGD